MNTEEKRIGNFTSSKIVALTKVARNKIDFGAAALTYIEEKNIENMIGKSIDLEAYSKSMAWGVFLESYVNDNYMPLDSDLVSQGTIIHETIEKWSGTPDFISENDIAELKCYQLKKFAQYSLMINKKNLEDFKKSFAQEYWQIVSNCIINKKEIGTAISFCPYESELPVIRKMAEQYDGEDQWKYRFIFEYKASDLACLPNDSKIKNFNSWSFTIPKEDIEFLTGKVNKAIKLLN